MSELLLKLTNVWNRAIEREEGQGMVEYALILVLVSIVAIGALAAIGTNVTNVLQTVADTLAWDRTVDGDRPTLSREKERSVLVGSA